MKGVRMSDKRGIPILSKKLRIKHTFPDELQSHFVNNVTVQHEPEYFVLQFFELWPPMIIGETDEEKLEALKKINQIEAKCVTRLVLTPAKMREVVDLMMQNLSNYEAVVGSESPGKRR